MDGKRYPILTETKSYTSAQNNYKKRKTPKYIEKDELKKIPDFLANDPYKRNVTKDKKVVPIKSNLDTNAEKKNVDATRDLVSRNNIKNNDIPRAEPSRLTYLGHKSSTKTPISSSYIQYDLPLGFISNTEEVAKGDEYKGLLKEKNVQRIDILSLNVPKISSQDIQDKKNRIDSNLVNYSKVSQAYIASQNENKENKNGIAYTHTIDNKQHSRSPFLNENFTKSHLGVFKDNNGFDTFEATLADSTKLLEPMKENLNKDKPRTQAYNPPATPTYDAQLISNKVTTEPYISFKREINKLIRHHPQFRYGYVNSDLSLIHI